MTVKQEREESEALKMLTVVEREGGGAIAEGTVEMETLGKMTAKMKVGVGGVAMNPLIMRIIKEDLRIQEHINEGLSAKDRPLQLNLVFFSRSALPCTRFRGNGTSQPRPRTESI